MGAGANTYAQLIDLIGEGPIGGPANGTWEKSTYYNEIPLQNEDGSWNYSGVEVAGRTGTTTQEYLPGFNGVLSVVAVGVDVTVENGAVSRTITDTDVDSVKVVLSIPSLLRQNDNGKIRPGSIHLAIYVTPENGAGTQQTVIDPDDTGRIKGTYTSEYRKQYTIKNLQQYGAAPWVITVERITADSDELTLVNAFSWYSYTKVIETKLRYYGRAVVGHDLNNSKFGDQIPERLWRINGLNDLKIPSNYNPETRTYTGDWDGTFTTGLTNNPAWIVYDMLTNVKRGLGERIAEDMVDKWSLYSCAAYCDEIISVATKTKQADGTYLETTFNEHRFSFNGGLLTRGQAMEAIVYVCGAMRVQLCYAGGQVFFVQDRPITAPARPVSISNTVDGDFRYGGVPKRNRHTVVNVQWSNPDLFGALDTIEMIDEQGVIDFGYNEMDFLAVGCTSRTEAVRRGRHVLDTDINARETVSFVGGLEWADALPGELIVVQDPNYAAITMEGRVRSGTTTSLVLDKELTLSDGATYTMLVQMAGGPAEERTLTNSAETTDTLTWDSPLPDIPFVGAVMVLSASNLAARKFVIVSVVESEDGFTVTGIEYDEDKYARIDSGVVTEIPVNTTLLTTILLPPTNLTIEPYTYTMGDQGLRLYGIQIGWTRSIDPRVEGYEVEHRTAETGWEFLAITTEPSYDWQDVPGDNYYIRVRSIGIITPSVWLTSGDFTMTTTLTDLAAPTNLDTFDGSGIWSGRDCTIGWDASTGSQYTSTYSDSVGDSNVDHYRVDIRKPDTTLLRTVDCAKGVLEFTYLYGWNVEDHAGTPSRNLLFYVYTVDVHGQPSASYATLSASNPAPDMSSGTPILVDKYGSLKITWTPVTDNDMEYYEVRFDTSSPPTTVYGRPNHPEDSLDAAGLDFDTSYYALIIPHDLFGPGVASQVSAAGNVLSIPAVNIDIELQDSITMSDTVGTSTINLAKLYNGDFGANGVAYTGATDRYIQYAYNIQNYFDRVAIWLSAAANVYVGYSVNGTDWSFLKAEADHTLDTDEALLAATNEADATTNYWTLASGKNVALFPNNITAKYIRLYILSGTVTIYEFVPSRMIISELGAIKYLSSYAGSFGLIEAGVAQTSGYTTSSGLRIDFDDGTIRANYGGETKLWFNPATGQVAIKGVITVESGSNVEPGATAGATWGTNVANRPTSLSGINSTEGSKLSGIETGADVTGNNTAYDTNRVGGVTASILAGWRYPGQTTIDGDSIQTRTILAEAIGTYELTVTEIYGLARINGNRLATTASGSIYVPDDDYRTVTHDLGRVVLVVTTDPDTWISNITTTTFDVYRAENSPSGAVGYVYI